MSSAAFIVFLIYIWALCWCHRLEHKRFVAEMKILQPMIAAAGADALAGRDWRLLSMTDREARMKRAFDITDHAAILRYALPVALIALMLIYGQFWGLAALYAALIAVKFFLLETVLFRKEARYEVRLFGVRLIGEDL